MSSHYTLEESKCTTNPGSCGDFALDDVTSRSLIANVFSAGVCVDEPNVLLACC
jgi:hypothetical protein